MASLRRKAWRLLPVFVLLGILHAPAYSQVEVELKHGGTLEGRVVAADDSTVTLRIDVGDQQSRDAVLRRSVIVVIEGSDAVQTEGNGATGTEPLLEIADAALMYRNELTAGILYSSSLTRNVPDVFLGVISSDIAQYMEFAYEYTSVPRVVDDEHHLRTSRLFQPSTSFSISSLANPTQVYARQSRREEIVYAHLLKPRFAFGGGVIIDSNPGDSYFEANTRNIFAARADFFASDNVRIRETAGGGWATIDDLFSMDTIPRRTAVMLRHRLDYLIAPGVLHEAISTCGYSQEIELQYIEDIGTHLYVSNGVEFALYPTLTYSIGIPLFLEFPQQGENDVHVAAQAELAWHPEKSWSIHLRVLGPGPGETRVHFLVSYRF